MSGIVRLHFFVIYFCVLLCFSRQWSWPINLPAQFFGIFPTDILRDGDDTTPWADEIEQKVLVSSVGIGPYIEVAFFHRKTKTLLVTDAVISVPDQPPEVRPFFNPLLTSIYTYIFISLYYQVSDLMCGGCVI